MSKKCHPATGIGIVSVREKSIEANTGTLKTVQAGLLAVLATAATCGPPRATLFTSSCAIQTYDVAASGLYDFTALGAQGGASVSSTGVSTSGGLGASAEGSVHLTAGDILDVIVGGMGGSGLVLGGGGSFVYDQTTNTLLFAAGGGGGAPEPSYDGGGSGNIANAPIVYGGSGGGGGGGYSGGAGYNYGSAGGGGGSYVDASVIDPVLTAGFKAGDGAITIAADAASVPEPTSIVLIGAGLSCLGALRRRAK